MCVCMCVCVCVRARCDRTAGRATLSLTVKESYTRRDSGADNRARRRAQNPNRYPKVALHNERSEMLGDEVQLGRRERRATTTTTTTTLTMTGTWHRSRPMFST